MKSEKRELLEGIEVPNQECIRMFGKKENKYLGILEAETIKQKWRKKIWKEYLRRTKNQTQQQKCHQKDKHQGSSPCNILRAILKMDKRGT